MKRLAKLETTKIKKLMSQLKDNRAQQASEYAVLIALVLAAVIGMEVYVRRGLQARYYGAVMSATKELYRIKQGQGVYAPAQYEPYYLKSQYEVTESSNKQTRAATYYPHVMAPPPPSLIRDEAHITSQSITDSRGSQETLSGNYGD